MWVGKGRLWVMATLTHLGYGTLTQDLGNSWGVGVLLRGEVVPVRLTTKGSFAGVVQGRPRGQDRAEIEVAGFEIHLEVPQAGRIDYYVTVSTLPPILALDAHRLPNYFWALPPGVPLTLELLLDWAATTAHVFHAQLDG